MNIHSNLKWLVSGCALLVAVGCGSERDVKVSGEIATGSDVAASKPIRVEFYERTAAEADGGEPTLDLVHSVVLDEPGSFTETVPLAGDDLLVVAIVDSDGDEACTDGEAWDSTEVTVDENDEVTVNLDIAPQTVCPSLNAAE